MKILNTVSIFVLIGCTISCKSQVDYPNQDFTEDKRITHIIVALCDNDHQGIVQVPSKIGNGQDPRNNLYWGALYGVKTFFKKQPEWSLVKSSIVNDIILERIIFRHTNGKDWLVADAYDGRYMKEAIQDYLYSLSGKYKDIIQVGKERVGTHGNASLVAFVGHNGLMDVNMDFPFPLQLEDEEQRAAIILACISKDYFLPLLSSVEAKPLLLTTGLMAPEAYTLDAAIDAVINNANSTQVHEAAAQAYHQYQKCGMNGARRLFWTEQ